MEHNENQNQYDQDRFRRDQDQRNSESRNQDASNMQAQFSAMASGMGGVFQNSFDNWAKTEDKPTPTPAQNSMPMPAHTSSAQPQSANSASNMFYAGAGDATSKDSQVYPQFVTQNSPFVTPVTTETSYTQKYIKDAAAQDKYDDAFAERVSGHGEAVVRAVDGGNYNQTDVGQGERRINEFTTMMSAVFVNYDRNTTKNNFDSMDFDKTGITDLYKQSSAKLDQYLSVANIDGEQGFRWQDPQKMTDLKFGVGDTQVGTVDAKFKCPDGTTMTLSQLEGAKGSLNFDLSECKMIRYDGVVLNMSVDEFKSMDLAKLAKQAQADTDAYNSLVKASKFGASYEDKVAAIYEIHNKQLDNLSSSNVEMRKIIDQFRNDPDKMNGKFIELLNSGKLSAVDQKALENYLKTGAKIPKETELGKSGQQGAKMIQDKCVNLILGDSDFGKVVKYQMKLAKTSEKVAKNAATFRHKVGIKNAQHKLNKAKANLEKIGKEGVQGKKAAEKVNALQEKVDKRVDKFNKFKTDKKATRKQNKALEKKRKAKSKFDAKTRKLDDKIKMTEKKYASLQKKQNDLVGKKYHNMTNRSKKNLNSYVNKLNKDTRGAASKLARMKKAQAKRLAKAQQMAAKKVSQKALGQALAKMMQAISKALTVVKQYILIGIAYFIAFIVGVDIIACCLAAVGGLVITMLNFNPIDELRANMPVTHLQDQLNNLNYNQYIVDKVSTELGTSFINVAKTDAKLHFLLRTRIPNMEGYYWYMDVVEGEVGNIWMREQADNVSTLDGNGYVSGYKEKTWLGTEGTGAKATPSSSQITYADYNYAVHPAYKVSNAGYVRNPDGRKRLKSVNSNVLPIVAMANYRFTEGIDYENFCDVMAYVYYMYVQSHDIAKYDSNNDDETYYAEISTKCKVYNASTGQWVDKIYAGRAERRWVMGTVDSAGKVSVPTTSATCSNIYVHGYDRLWGADIMAAKAEMQEFCTDVENWLRNNTGAWGTLFNAIFENSGEKLPVGTELVKKNSSGGYSFSGNSTNCTWHSEYYGDISTGTAGMGNIELDANNESDLDRNSDLYGYFQTGSAFVDHNAHLACNNMKFYQWTDQEDKFASSATVDSNDTIVANGLYSDTKWHGVTCGYAQHKHNYVAGSDSLGCVKFTCSTPEHTHNLFCSCNFGMSYHSQNQHDLGIGCTYAEATHYDYCYVYATKYYKVTTVTTRIYVSGQGYVSSSSSLPDEEISESEYNSLATGSSHSGSVLNMTITSVSKTTRSERTNTLTGNCGHRGSKTCTVHVHTDACCDIEQHKHLSSNQIFAPIIHDAREQCGGELPATGYFIVYSQNRLDDNVSGWVFSGDGKYASGGTTYGAVRSCQFEISECGLPEHTHDDVVWSYTQDEYGNLIEDHSRFPENPGCWQIIAICQGHCGGHLKPVINVVVTDTFEGLMVQDNFKMTHAVSWYDFNAAATTFSGRIMPTVGCWKFYWSCKAAAWFSPFPSSPAAGIAYIQQKALYWQAGLMDSFTSWFSTADDDEAPEYEEDESVESVDQFDGWWVTEYSVDVSKLSYLREYYGDWNDPDGEYSKGVDIFSHDGMGVDFPMGINHCLDSLEITNIMKQLTDMGLTERQLNIAKDALDKAGAFYYSDSLYARQNAALHDDGAADLSGFVLGIFNKANGKHESLIPFKAQGEFASGYTQGLCCSQYSSSFEGGRVSTGDVLLSEDNECVCVIIGYVSIREGMPSANYCLRLSKQDGGTVLTQFSAREYDRIIHYTNTSL